MWAQLLRLLTTGAAYYAIGKGASQIKVSPLRIRQWLIGAAIAFASSLVGILGIIVLLLSLFFQLADMNGLVLPALITAGISLLASLVGLFESRRWFRS